MSHFTVMVFGEDHEALLAPFDEALDVAPRREYMSGRDYLRFVLHYQQEDETFRGDPEHPSFDEFAKAWNGRGIFFDAKILPEPYELTTYNPNSKWDWYQVGGRWDGSLMVPYADDSTKHRGVNQAFFRNIDWEATPRPYAFITTHGEWFQKGEMGWWGMAFEEDEHRYEADWKLHLERLAESEVLVTAVDCHI